MFSLATELGMTVQSLELNIGAYELSEWIAYYKILAEKNKEGA